MLIDVCNCGSIYSWDSKCPSSPSSHSARSRPKNGHHIGKEHSLVRSLDGESNGEWFPYSNSSPGTHNNWCFFEGLESRHES